MDILEEADMGFYGFHESEKGNVILVKSYRFALRIVQIYHLLKEKREYDIGRQLLRAGTSVGANVNEATAGQSRKDFAAKMAVASKEARETRYWLRIIIDSQLVEADLSDDLKAVNEIIAILTKIMKTAQTKTHIS